MYPFWEALIHVNKREFTFAEEHFKSVILYQKISMQISASLLVSVSVTL